MLEMAPLFLALRIMSWNKNRHAVGSVLKEDLTKLFVNVDYKGAKLVLLPFLQ